MHRDTHTGQKLVKQQFPPFKKNPLQANYYVPCAFIYVNRIVVVDAFPHEGQTSLMISHSLLYTT